MYQLFLFPMLRFLHKLSVRGTAPKGKEDSVMALWKDVPGYEGLYLVSDAGAIMSTPKIISNGRGTYKRGSRILKPGCRGRGKTKYEFVVLTKNNKPSHLAVHRLVASAFLENPLHLPEVNHKDENPLNNCLSNLEWCTRQYNIDYSKSKRVEQYTLDGEKVAEYKSISTASKITGVKRTAINNNLTGWAKSAGGYIWNYVKEE